jgi:hypothetical protein
MRRTCRGGGRHGSGAQEKKAKANYAEDESESKVDREYKESMEKFKKTLREGTQSVAANTCGPVENLYCRADVG